MGTLIRQTGFRVVNDDESITDLRFGILVPTGSPAMTDWERESRIAEFPGIGGHTEIQRLGFGPRRVTYRVFLESRADLRTLDSLTQRIGTLTIVYDGHSVPVDPEDNDFIHGKGFTHVESVLLYSLANRALFVSSCEVDATFVQVSS